MRRLPIFLLDDSNNFYDPIWDVHVPIAILFCAEKILCLCNNRYHEKQYDILFCVLSKWVVWILRGYYYMVW